MVPPSLSTLGTTTKAISFSSTNWPLAPADPDADLSKKVQFTLWALPTDG